MIYINARFLTQPITGVQRFSIELCKELNKIRSDLVFLVPSLDLILDKSLLDIFNIVEVKGGSGHFWEQFVLPKFLKKEGNPLLVNLCSTAPILYTNQIVTHHDVTYIRYPQSFSWKFRFFYKTIVPIILKASKRIITVSNFSKIDISNVYDINSEKFEVIYNAVSKDFIYDSVKKRKPYFLAVSSPSYHKNFHRLIEAFLESKSEFELYIIGGQVSSFKKLDYKNNSRIKFIGKVSDSDLIKYYQEASFFIFPSLYEGFGIPPLEAQACGCPVIASNAASIPEVLGSSALFFNPSDKSEIKNLIEKVSIDTDLQQNLRELGLLNLKRFSWEISANKLDSIIEEVK